MMIKNTSYEYKWEDVQGNVIYTGGQMLCLKLFGCGDQLFVGVVVTDSASDSVEGFS